MIKATLTLTLFLIFTFANAQSGGNANSSFYEIKPALVVNIYNPRRIKFLQVEMQVKVDDPSIVSALELHQPAIRHSMLLLLSSQNMKEIKTLKGKEKLRKDALAEMNKVLMESTGKKGISNLFFTGFIIQ